MRSEFIQAIDKHQAAFGLRLDDRQIDKLANYYELIREHNEFLHLVAPCAPEEFAIRHILESLSLLEYLPDRSRFADVGTGAGLPSIPCLLVRKDLKALLIESKEKKAKFLELAVERLDLKTQVEIANKQFQEVEPVACESVTCRALDKFTERLPAIDRWRKRRQMLLFGGPTLRTAIEAQRLKFIEKLMPMSEQRYLFVVRG